MCYYLSVQFQGQRVNVIHVLALMNNSHDKIYKCTNVELYFLNTIFRPPTCFDLDDPQGVTEHKDNHI